MLNILVVGGYGTFGGRLVDLLADREGLTLFVAGRSLAAAQNFCWKRESKAKLVPLQFDRMSPAATLEALKPNLVVDASGPFQVYGDEPYILPRSCIALGSNYIDLADGAAFVRGIGELDAAAKDRGVFALSGMSSFPVLTNAISKLLARDLDEVETIAAGIAPSPYAGVGLNVVKAIASYSGKPVDILIDGQWTTRAGFFDSRRMQVNVPGTVPLPSIRFALCDVPDLKVLGWEFPTAKSIWIGAGPTPAVLHRLLWACAGLVKRGWLPSLLPFARIMNMVINTVRWGEHRGGLVLEMTGRKAGVTRQESWHLLAEGEGGPMIPSMAAAAVVEKMLKATPLPAGARPGHNDLTLEDYAPWFRRYSIATGRRSETLPSQPIYRQVLGEAFARLDAPVQAFHAADASFRMKGEARVTAPGNPLARLLRRIFGFPSAYRIVPVAVDISVSPDSEVWQRRFAGHPMRSVQKLGQGRNAGLIVESFGPLDFAMAVVDRAGELHLLLRRWTVFGVPLPKALMPTGHFSEHGRDGRFHFHVDIRLPVLGRIVCYEGWLEKA